MGDMSPSRQAVAGSISYGTGPCKGPLRWQQQSRTAAGASASVREPVTSRHSRLLRLPACNRWLAGCVRCVAICSSPMPPGTFLCCRSSLPRLRRAELEMERVQIDVLEAVQHLEYVRLSLLNLPSTQQEWAALRALGPRACLDIEQLMDQAEMQDFVEPWLPQGLLSLDSGAEVHMEVLGLPPLPWSGVALNGLDRVPGLRRLALTCNRWRGPALPPQLQSCSQLTQLYIGHARLYPPYLPAGVLSQLPALLRLQLRNCLFRPAGQLRDDMCSLSQLTSLCVIRRGQHCLTVPDRRSDLQIPPAQPLHLPPDVSQLRSLQQLALEGWQLTGLEAVSATALTELSLAGGQVGGHPAVPAGACAGPHRPAPAAGGQVRGRVQVGGMAACGMAGQCGSHGGSSPCHNPEQAAWLASLSVDQQQVTFCVELHLHTCLPLHCTPTRLNLGATCKALHRCCPRWSAGLEVELNIDVPAKATHLAAWLQRHAGAAHRCCAVGPGGQNAWTVMVLQAPAGAPGATDMDMAGPSCTNLEPPPLAATSCSPRAHSAAGAKHRPC